MPYFPKPLQPRPYYAACLGGEEMATNPPSMAEALPRYLHILITRTGATK